jgi:hypothetical protein
MAERRVWMLLWMEYYFTLTMNWRKTGNCIVTNNTVRYWFRSYLALRKWEKETFKDTKGVIRIRISNDGKYNCPKQQDKQWPAKHYTENYRLSNMNPTKYPDATKELVVHALIETPVVLLIKQHELPVIWTSRWSLIYT